MRQRVKIVIKEEIVRELYAIAGEDAVQTAEPMKNHTTFRVGGPADYFVAPHTEEEIRKIADTYINYKNDENYEDIQGFCKVADLDEIREHDYILTPGRYVGIEDAEDDGEPFEEKMERLTQQLAHQFQKSKELEDEIRKQLGGLGYVL